MLATVIENESVRCIHRPDPVPMTREVLVRVEAAGVNGADLLQRRGRYPAPADAPPDIPGLEFAGEVVALGPATSRFAVGDRVMGLVGGGAQAELITVHERVAMPVPAGLDWVAAGALPEIFSTAFDALFGQAHLQPGERVLVNGGAGGVGTAAVQLAAWAGATVVATVRRPELAERVASLGAVTVVAEVGDRQAEEHGPFDVVLELVGAANLPNSLRWLARGGRVCMIGVGAGAKAEVNVLHLMSARGTVHGSTLRSAPLESKAALARDVERHVLPGFEQGRLAVHVDATFPLADVHDAYEHFAAGGKFGKVVLTMS
jgi:NADPH:quinone reductase